MFRSDRSQTMSKKGGGGLLVYVKDKYPVTKLLKGSTPSQEMIWLSIFLPHARAMNICGLYRPPDASLDLSIQNLESQFEQLDPNHETDLVLIGNNNVDYLKNNSHKKKLKNFLKATNLSQVITQINGAPWVNSRYHSPCDAGEFHA